MQARKDPVMQARTRIPLCTRARAPRVLYAYENEEHSPFNVYTSHAELQAAEATGRAVLRLENLISIFGGQKKILLWSRDV